MSPTTLRVALSQGRLRRAMNALAALPARMGGFIARRRRSRAVHAASLDSHLLLDIGLTRADIAWPDGARRPPFRNLHVNR